MIVAAIFEEAKMASSGLQRTPGLVSDFNEYVNHHQWSSVKKTNDKQKAKYKEKH